MGTVLPAAAHETCGVSLIDDRFGSYRPTAVSAAVWQVIGETVIEWVAQTDAPTVVPADTRAGNHRSLRTAKRALSVTAQFVAYCWQSCGYGLDPDALLRVGVIDEFVCNGLAGVSDSTRATYRADLIKVARAVRPGDESLIGTTRLSGQEAVNPPYTNEQEQLLDAWAGAQPSQYAVVNAKVLLGCGLGAGLTTAELLALQASHVEVDDSADDPADGKGVLIHVPGSNPRAVPVRITYEKVLAEVAASAWKPDQYLFRPNRTSVHSNGVNNFLSRSVAVPFPVSMQRLRTTWIINHLAAGVPIPAVRQAAGIRQRSGLRRYLDFLVEPHPDDARRALRHCTGNGQGNGQPRDGADR